MNLHGQIMNLPAKKFEPGEMNEEAYKLGHRDARHAAAELALQADAEIERLRDRVTVLNLALMALLPVARTGGDVMSQEHASVVAMAEDALKA